ncbi:glucose-6-phosphate dehydrogenase assembly protein OpcA [Corynebacterium lowii]|uniref:Glucose-6-phosphate dehydrogenase subunit n=1 Tax=Corynebacterium lowii TaxID=1544413 RepID=A0A0Q0UGQ2_9CORY|nr:glucose-6-phosphate dehydrogenase assembly protein OpcA [Corynebacterium lowii]KQB85809.1 Glucose-6-phosphate dehydrogenase subunit [Corynebacterium lowii]MDP9851111.1 glucose-6-phosphate dehydrogenase assembly protein OpcA [Corynebacterium lowii]
MIIDLPNTTTRDIAASLQHIHETTAQTTGRVLTLIVMAGRGDDLPEIIHATTDASWEHPSRVLVLIDGGSAPTAGVDAEIRVGGTVGASEFVIMTLRGEVAAHANAVVTPLLLPDTPIVVWWPSEAPECPSQHPVGRLAQRRITDAPLRPESYAPGDSDLAWARITQWRGIVASSLDSYPQEEVSAVEIKGPKHSPSIDLAAGWLACRLGVPVHRGVSTHEISGDLEPCELRLERVSGPITIHNRSHSTVSVRMPQLPESLVAMNHRSVADCLAEELRHLDPDVTYAEALEGISSVIFEEEEK